MTDTELEQMARKTRGELMEGSGHWEDDIHIILAALKTVNSRPAEERSSTASVGSADTRPSDDLLRRKYAHFRALAICARELLTNEAHACKPGALKDRLMDAAKVIDGDLKADALAGPQTGGTETGGRKDALLPKGRAAAVERVREWLTQNPNFFDMNGLTRVDLYELVDPPPKSVKELPSATGEGSTETRPRP
jgi:hypothetical protein